MLDTIKNITNPTFHEETISTECDNDYNEYKIIMLITPSENLFKLVLDPKIEENLSRIYFDYDDANDAGQRWLKKLSRCECKKKK